MHGFGRPVKRPHLCALALLHGFACGVVAGNNQAVEKFGMFQDVSAKGDVFSAPWLEQYIGAAPGCTMGRGIYTWRGCGFGSNINMEGWSDLSLISDDRQFEKLDCFNESGGFVSHGWGCLFSSIQHICVFDTAEAWTNHMVSANVSTDDQQKAAGVTLGTIRSSTTDIVNSLQELNIDHFGALSVLTKYLWGHMTPWLRNDVSFVIHAEKVFEGSPFLGMHIRRGDKLRAEAKAVDVKDYLKAAVTYFDDENTSTGVNGIKAIWVASDDPHIVDEVRTLAPAYFPEVPREAIVYVANGVPGGSITRGVNTFTRRQGYGSFVYLLADFERLAAADLFVGTFSSNVGRLVVLLRENLGKPRKSSISLDHPSWYAGRQRRDLVN